MKPRLNNMGEQKKRRLPSDVRKQQIYDSFIDLIIERGYDSISLSTIAEKIGISKPAVFQHVGNKEQLLEHLIEEYKEQIKKPIIFDIVNHSAIETLNAFYEAFCKGEFGSEREMRLRRALFSQKELRDKIQEVSMKGSDLISETILPILVYGRDSGEIRTDVPPQELANIVWMWFYSGTALTDIFPRFRSPSFERCIELIENKKKE